MTGPVFTSLTFWFPNTKPVFPKSLSNATRVEEMDVGVWKKKNMLLTVCRCHLDLPRAIFSVCGV